MPLMLWQGKPLIVGGKLAMHERCCCVGGCVQDDPTSATWDGSDGGLTAQLPSFAACGGGCETCGFSAVNVTLSNIGGSDWEGTFSDGGCDFVVTLVYAPNPTPPGGHHWRLNVSQAGPCDRAMWSGVHGGAEGAGVYTLRCGQACGDNVGIITIEVA